MNEKNERKMDNLINLVENHTRTERHLEQYSHIGDPIYKEKAREKQHVREEQIDSLKSQILDEHQKISAEEHLANLKENYEKTKNYLGNNLENLSYEQVHNMAEKQINQAKQIAQMEQRNDESGKYTI